MKTLIYKTNILVAFLLILIGNTSAQQWHWSFSAGTIDKDIPGYFGAAISDMQQNLYFTMKGEGGAYLHFPDTFINSYNYKHVIAKYDTLGNKAWFRLLRSYGSYNGGTPFNIIYDAIHEEPIIIGAYDNTLTNGIDTINNGSSYMVKFSKNGDLLWLKNFKLGLHGSLIAGAIDQAGDIYTFVDNFSGTNIDSIPMPTKGGYLAKFGANGNLIWLKKIVESCPHWYTPSQKSSLYCIGIKVINDKIFLAGNKVCANLIIDTLDLSSQTSDYVLACFDTSANLHWARSFPTGYFPSGLTLDNQKNIYSFTLTNRYFACGIDSFYNVSGNQYHFYSVLFKADSLGNPIWAKKIESTNGAVSIRNVALSPSQYLFITGYFSGTAQFGDLTITTPYDTALFFAKYNSDGICLAVDHLGKAEGFYACPISDETAFVVGTFKNSITLGSQTHTSYGDWDVFAGKYQFPSLTNIERKEQAVKETLQIFANPNTGKCTISIPESMLLEEQLVLYIYDLKGKLIYQQPISLLQSQIKIDIASEAKGIYKAVLTNGKKSVNGTIVFE